MHDCFEPEAFKQLASIVRQERLFRRKMGCKPLLRRPTYCEQPLCGQPSP